MGESVNGALSSTAVSLNIAECTVRRVTMLFGVLQNGLVLLNVSSYIQQIIIGLILILAVAFDKFSKSSREV